MRVMSCVHQVVLTSYRFSRTCLPAVLYILKYCDPLPTARETLPGLGGRLSNSGTRRKPRR